ncbi:hypothetical protein TSAR_003930, partial [Trichomalopsis sarcophagae]
MQLERKCAVGSACISPQINYHGKHRLNEFSSVFTAECVALNNAFDIALENLDKNINIYTASLSTLLSLQSTKNSIKVNAYILDIKSKYNTVNSLKKSNTAISLFSVPAHKGIWGNELTDSTAKNAALSETIDITKTPFTDLYEHFKKESYNKTENSITSQGAITGKKTISNIYTKINDSPDLISINQIRSNHYNFAASLAKLNIIEFPRCSCNNDIEDINHVIWNCPKCNVQREKLMSILQKMNPPFNTKAFVASPCFVACALIVSFLRKCDIRPKYKTN